MYGFISIQNELIYDLIQHPYFQRLRYIKQLGLSNLVYPGAQHTRFHHALGALHLMDRVIKNLRQKGIEVSEQEEQAALIAILLHDIGHGPLSHALEETLLQEVHHESLSFLFMKTLNSQFNGELEMAMSFFRNTYPRKFFHQLISSQLDIDRLDYLKRDSFFTGVMEGTVGVDRIISMLSVHHDELVVEEKGIYSIESFLHSRRLMYWQVYLHKTALSAERMIVNIIRRAQYLLRAGENLVASPALKDLLTNTYTIEDWGGNGMVVPGYGFLLNNELTDFDFAPPHPNIPEAGKRPRSSIAPFIAMKNGKPVFTIGSPGGSTIITTVLQSIVNYVDMQMPMVQAIAARRLSERNESKTQVEPSFINSVQANGLATLGHAWQVDQSDPEIGAANALVFNADGTVTAVSETQRHGVGSAKVQRKAH